MLINLTPHAITLAGTVIPASGQVARCNEISMSAGEFDGVPVVTRQYGEVTGLPAPKPGTSYIVSALVRTALPERKDVFSPGDLIRDADGNITGCKNLVSN